MPWRLVGEASFGPGSDTVIVGPVRVPRSGGLEVRVTGGQDAPFQFGYCVLGFESTYGHELGTVRVWPRPTVSGYLLGAGITVSDTVGHLFIRPRTWNLRWVEAGFPLSVRVLANEPSVWSFDIHTPNGYSNETGQELTVTPVGDLGSLTF